MPINCFQKFGHLSNHHMALAQHLSIPAYLKFFQEKVQAGETVILDNGAYEGVQMAPELLHRWIMELRPTVAILPDSPGDFRKTLCKSHEFLLRHTLPRSTQGMTVLHAANGELKQFEVAYELVETEWVGFSRLTKYYEKIVPWPYHRAGFAEHLKVQGMWRSGLKHHALGMLNGCVSELKALAEQGFSSCDSSAPVWRGLHGYTLRDAWPNYEYQPDMNESFSPQYSQAGLNLQVVLEACGQD